MPRPRVNGVASVAGTEGECKVGGSAAKGASSFFRIVPAPGIAPSATVALATALPFRNVRLDDGISRDLLFADAAPVGLSSYRAISIQKEPRILHDFPPRHQCRGPGSVSPFQAMRWKIASISLG